jgi:hypothetical protein
VIALPFSFQRRPWFLRAWRLFEHGGGFEESVSRVELLGKKVGAQAFAASFPAVNLGLVLKAIASLFFAVGGLRAQVFGFQRGRTRASQLLSFAMSQRANQTPEPTRIAVTAAVFAPAAPSTRVAQL